MDEKQPSSLRNAPGKDFIPGLLCLLLTVVPLLFSPFFFFFGGGGEGISRYANNSGRPLPSGIRFISAGKSRTSHSISKDTLSLRSPPNCCGPPDPPGVQKLPRLEAISVFSSLVSHCPVLPEHRAAAPQSPPRGGQITAPFSRATSGQGRGRGGRSLPGIGGVGQSCQPWGGLAKERSVISHHSTSLVLSCRIKYRSISIKFICASIHPC